MDGWMDGWMDDFIYPDPSPKRYAGYHNYIYPKTYCHIRKQIPPHTHADRFPNPILKHASLDVVTYREPPAKLYCPA